MAIYSNNYTQSTSEIRTYTVDYSESLPTGGTVTAGTAVHIPPSGAAGTISITVSSPYVYVTTPVFTVIGNHYIDVLGTFSDNDKLSVRLAISVVYPTATAREGMSDLITEVRQLSNAGDNEFTIAGVPYFSDKHIQTALDNNRRDFQFAPMEVYPEQAVGSVVYKEFHTEPYIESGTLFYLQTAGGSAVGTSLYSVDYTRGVVTFTSDTAGTAFYASGRTYDVYTAAAEIWDRKASNVANQVDWSSDNHSVKNSQVFQFYQKQAQTMRGMGKQNSVTIYRGDTN